ncbi:MAG: hypothetical protein H5T83_13980, partial [Actinotalea sp.]|nr:hypothetical protein [Actinotalea sp.]
MDQAGIVLVAVAGLWIAYLVPHRSRYRQQLLESRTEDRFSEHLRVLRVAHAAGGPARGAVRATTKETAAVPAPHAERRNRSSGGQQHP